MRACVYVCMCVFMCVCVCVCRYIIDIHTDFQPKEYGEGNFKAQKDARDLALRWRPQLRLCNVDEEGGADEHCLQYIEIYY